MSLDLVVDVGAARAALARVAAANLPMLLAGIGAEVESQTRQRLQTGKRAPDGTPWAPWSKGYAKRRGPGHSLLRGRGGLLDSITHRVEGDSVLIGSNLRYAAIHQLGGLPGMAPGPAAIPARSYLGLSEADRADIQAMVADTLAALVAGG